MALKHIEVDNKKVEISYEIINPSNKKDIVFIHGWGSNKEIMKIFKNYFKDFRHIYLDLPGFGKSKNNYVLTTFDYAKIVDKFLNEINSTRDVIIGHSFGGKVAILLNPKLLVLLSSAGIVLEKPLSVRLKIKIFKLLRKIGLSFLWRIFASDDVKRMGENMYETFKNVVDEDFSEIFKNYKNKVLIFGAEDDRAVPIKAIKKQEELFNTKAIILKGDHYFFFNNLENLKIIEKKVNDKI